jgi:hypothetical protein
MGANGAMRQATSRFFADARSYSSFPSLTRCFIESFRLPFDRVGQVIIKEGASISSSCLQVNPPPVAAAIVFFGNGQGRDIGFDIEIGVVVHTGIVDNDGQGAHAAATGSTIGSCHLPQRRSLSLTIHHDVLVFGVVLWRLCSKTQTGGWPVDPGACRRTGERLFPPRGFRPLVVKNKTRTHIKPDYNHVCLGVHFVSGVEENSTPNPPCGVPSS